MKTVILGDTHGRSAWKQVIGDSWDRLIFLGDYFDSFDISAEDQINNFLEIVTFKERSDREVIMLMGNHDIGYFPNMIKTDISGYQNNYMHIIGHALQGARSHLQMAYQFDDVLCTHAGVSEEWLTDKYPGWEMGKVCQTVNDIWQYRPTDFEFYGFNPYGDDTYQTPVWIRPKSLMKANKEMKKHYIQVVGHTRVDQIDIKGKATNGRYFFIDAIDSKQYLINNDGKFEIGHLN